MTPPQGRARLDRIAIEWAERHALYPQKLAEQMAGVLRSLSPDWATISPEKVGASLSDGPPGAITIGALADYFHQVGLGNAPRTITTTSGDVLTAAVTVDRAWIALPFAEAVKRAAFASGFAASANDSPSATAVANGSPAAYQTDQPPPPTGSEPGYLKMRQAQQRKEGESSAAEQLDAERIARQQDQRELIELRAMLATRDAQVLQLREENEELRRELSAARRAKLEAEDEMIGMEEQLEEAMAFAECLRADNEVSPPELRLAFQCWREITRDGTHNPAGPGGRGVHLLASDWLEDNGHVLRPDAKARFCAVLSWRKRGSGAIRTK